LSGLNLVEVAPHPHGKAVKLIFLQQLAALLSAITDEPAENWDAYERREFIKQGSYNSASGRSGSPAPAKRLKIRPRSEWTPRVLA
jgi:hypothetical protein